MAQKHLQWLAIVIDHKNHIGLELPWKHVGPAIPRQGGWDSPHAIGFSSVTKTCKSILLSFSLAVLFPVRGQYQTKIVLFWQSIIPNECYSAPPNDQKLWKQPHALFKRATIEQNNADCNRWTVVEHVSSHSQFFPQTSLYHLTSYKKSTDAWLALKKRKRWKAELWWLTVSWKLKELLPWWNSWKWGKYANVNGA